MIKTSLNLYEQMLKEMAAARSKGMPVLREIEYCFQLSRRYLTTLKRDVFHHVFDCPATEIDFFKRVKPLFSSEMEFQSLRYHAQLFIESTCGADLSRFWERELRRLPKFITENRDFADHYRSGCTKNDILWFTRPDRAAGDSSCRDHLAGSFMALEKYDQYIRRLQYAWSAPDSENPRPAGGSAELLTGSGPGNE